MKPLKKTSFLVVLALLISFGLQIATIAKWSVWHDEGYTAMLVDSSPSELVRRTGYDVHPPFYYFALKGWSVLVGDSDVRLRLFSVCFMLATIYVTFLLARKVYGEKSARWSLLPLTLAPVLIRYGQEMRMYSLASFVGVSATLVLAHLLLDDKSMAKSKKTRLIVLYTVLAALLPYIHYFSSLLLVAHALVVRAHYRDTHTKKERFFREIVSLGRVYKWWVFSMLVVVVLFLPWVGKFIEQSSAVTSGFWISPVSAQSFVSTLASFVTFRPVWREWRLEGWYALMALGLVAVQFYSVKIYLRRATSSVQKTLALSYFIAPAVILFLLSLPPNASLYYDRYMVTFSPLFYVSMGIVMSHLWDNRNLLKSKVLAVFIVLPLICGVVVASVYGNNFGLTPSYYFHAKDLISTWQPLYKAGDGVVVQEVWQYFNVRFYVKDLAGEPKLYSKYPLNKYGNSSLLYDREDLLIDNMEKSGQKTGRVWMFRSTDRDFSSLIPASWVKTVTYTNGESSVDGFVVPK